MSQEITESDADEAYLYEQLEKLGKRPTDSQIEQFVERVAIMVANGKHEAQARREALFGLTGQR